MERFGLKEGWLQEERKSFRGWDFSYLQNRMQEEVLPWNYDKIVRQYLESHHQLLDMGTGGGEYLLTLSHPFHNIHATESYLPNVALCKQVLSPLGIDIRQIISDDALPFDDQSFHIILNRHESFNIQEVFRVLKPQGMFITQQVGGLNNKELSKFLIKDFQEIVSSDFTLENNLAQISSSGFQILKSDEYFPKIKFMDIGALVYFAKIIEWEFPGFTVEMCFEQLCQLQNEINKVGYVESTEHRFLIVAQKE